jgi:hypothetical protein
METEQMLNKLEGHIETDHEYMRSNTATVRTTGLYAEQ